MQTTSFRAPSLFAVLACSFVAFTGAAHAAVSIVPMSSTTPTLSQLLNTANIEYGLGSGSPLGVSPFLVNGVQVSFTDSINGVQSNVWKTNQGQLIIAFQGTEDPQQAVADIGVAAQTVTIGEKESLLFVKTFLAYARTIGISPSDIFLTGHSLGGIEAEYVAQQTGLPGVAFEPTGIPLSSNAGNGSNFVDVVVYGDPVGSYSSDIRALQPIAPPYVKHGGTLPHYGVLVEIGNPQDEVNLRYSFQNVGVLVLVPGILNFHVIGTQAHDLEITFNPFLPLIDTLANVSARPIDAGSLTIPQFLALTK